MCSKNFVIMNDIYDIYSASYNSYIVKLNFVHKNTYYYLIIFHINWKIFNFIILRKTTRNSVLPYTQTPKLKFSVSFVNTLPFRQCPMRHSFTFPLPCYMHHFNAVRRVWQCLVCPHPPWCKRLLSIALLRLRLSPFVRSALLR